jgi:hypothetical protein
MRTLTRLLLSSALLWAGPARAHVADMIFAWLEPREGGYLQRLTMTADTLSLLAPIDADGDRVVTQAELDGQAEAIALGVWGQAPLFSEEGRCELAPAARAFLRERFVELHATFTCAGPPARQQFRLLSVLPSGYRVVSSFLGVERFAEGAEQTVVFGPAQATQGPRPLAGWVWLGMVHIFLGVDHLAFVFALLLVSGTWRRLLLLVSSFTVAHSITLGASALGWVPLTPFAERWVEVVIAASIVWVAAENLLLGQHRHRAALTFGFGLVHGFGFASVLRGYGLGESAWRALLGFNLGVEVGQVAVVGAALPLLWLARRRPIIDQWTVRVGSTAVGVAGALWLVQRVLG